MLEVVALTGSFAGPLAALVGSIAAIIADRLAKDKKRRRKSYNAAVLTLVVLANIAVAGLGIYYFCYTNEPQTHLREFIALYLTFPYVVYKSFTHYGVPEQVEPSQQAEPLQQAEPQPPQAELPQQAEQQQAEQQQAEQQQAEQQQPQRLGRQRFRAPDGRFSYDPDRPARQQPGLGPEAAVQQIPGNANAALV